MDTLLVECILQTCRNSQLVFYKIAKEGCIKKINRPLLLIFTKPLIITNRTLEIIYFIELEICLQETLVIIRLVVKLDIRQFYGALIRQKHKMGIEIENTIKP